MNIRSFARELCDSRAFCRQAGMCSDASTVGLGGNAGGRRPCIDADQSFSPGAGLRHTDEPVYATQMLDAWSTICAGSCIAAYWDDRIPVFRARPSMSRPNTSRCGALFATPRAALMVA